MTDIWQAALRDLETKVSSHNFESWFKNIRFHHQEGRVAHLEVGDEFFKVWIEENYVDLIEESLSSVSASEMRVVLHVMGDLGEALRHLDIDDDAEPMAAREARIPQDSNAQADIFAPKTPPQPVSPPRTPDAINASASAASTSPKESSRPAPTTSASVDLDERIRRAGLNPRYTFEEFVVGPSNQFSHAACISIANNPGENYNPLFIFGGVGLGKTHLLQAIGIESLRQRPEARVVTLSSEEFMNQLITSLRQKDMNSFRAQFRDNCDVLLIDDIQFIGGKDSTQEEFFHTFNALYHSGKQIVMTSDKSPKELPGIEERLQSRFSWGLIADVQAPEIETRLAILEKKAEADNIQLNKEVAMLLASAVRTNVRELEGILVRLGAQASLMNQPITEEMARKQLKRMNIEEDRQVSVDKIINIVADRYGITARDICGSRRTRNISEPRQYAMYLSRKLTDHSYPELGRQFGGKDHTTVLAAFKKLEELVETDPDLATDMHEIEAKLR